MSDEGSPPAGSEGPAARRIVLLGGVNVGGHRLAMTDLRAVLGETGCTDIVTYIQSGNAVVLPPSPEPGDLAASLSEAITAVAGYRVPVVLRTRDDLAALVDANPYPGTEGNKLHVVFFAEPPRPGVLDDLDLPSFLPEECAQIGRDLYLHLPNGMGRATLPTALARAGRRADPTAVSTARNWNTVLTLLALADR